MAVDSICLQVCLFSVHIEALGAGEGGKCLHRLGQGGGYYDRYLAGFQGFTVALCRDALLRDEIPTQPHDVPVQLVVTETRSLSPDRAERSGAFAPLPM